LPVTEGGGTLDRDTFLSFQIHAIHLGAYRVFASYLMSSREVRLNNSENNLKKKYGHVFCRVICWVTYLVNVLNPASIIENALCQCGFARVDVCRDADISLELKSLVIPVRQLVCKFLWASRDFIEGFHGSRSRGSASASEGRDGKRKAGRMQSLGLRQKTAQEHCGPQFTSSD